MPKELRDALLPQKANNTAAVPASHEWLFHQSVVPKSEIVACACWEYLREVPLINLGSTGYKGYARKMICTYRSHEAQRKLNDAFDHIPLNVLLYLARDPEAMFDLPPWQNLDKNLRRDLNKPMPKAWGPLIEMDVIVSDLISWNLRMPDPGEFETPRPWEELELEVYALACADLARRKLSKEQDQSLGAIPSIPISTEIAKAKRSINDFSVHDPRSWLIPYASNKLARPAPFLINWGEYTVEEIVDAFRDWVERTCPRFTPSPRGKGTRFTVLRSALRDLGALRIIKAMPADEFVARHDEDYLQFQQPWDGRKPKKNLPYVDLEKLRRSAVNFFQEHFATARGMKPRSWQKPRTKKRKLVAPTGELPDFTAG